MPTASTASDIIRVRVHPDHKRLFEKAAKLRMQDLSTFAREAMRIQVEAMRSEGKKL